MQGTFAEGILKWRDFYALVGGAAAGLLGLLFVSVSLHLDVITKSVGNEVRILSEQTFLSFIYVLLISMLFMIPYQNATGLGLPLLAMGVLACLRTASNGLQFWRARQAPQRMLGSHYVLRRFVYPVVSYVGLTFVSLIALRGRSAALLWVLVVVLVLLLSATINAWELMLLLAEAKREGPQ
jgi:hypothetical protein